MFIYCSRCDWNQDDFWSDDYNPIEKNAENLAELIKKAIDQEQPQRLVSTDRTEAVKQGMPFDIDRNGNAQVDIRDYLAKKLENLGRRIREMHWLTKEDFDQDTNQTCPRCGSTVRMD